MSARPSTRSGQGLANGLRWGGPNEDCGEQDSTWLLLPTKVGGPPSTPPKFPYQTRPDYLLPFFFFNKENSLLHKCRFLSHEVRITRVGSVTLGFTFPFRESLILF